MVLRSLLRGSRLLDEDADRNTTEPLLLNHFVTIW